MINKKNILMMKVLWMKKIILMMKTMSIIKVRLMMTIMLMKKMIMIGMVKIMLFIDEEYENYNFTDYTEFGETKTKHTSYSW